MVGLPRHEFTAMPADASALPALLCFHDVAVVPNQAVERHIAIGGPIWPDFDRQIAARHCRDRQAVDRLARPAARSRDLSRPAVWGGYLSPHFGHLIIEHLTRLPQSLHERPDDLVLFTLPPGTEPDDIPRHVLQLLDWYGVPVARRRYATAPLMVSTLHVAAQPEMMGTVSPMAGFLDLLGKTMARNGLAARPQSVVFVARPGFVARGLGGLVGEAYLCDRLAAAGVLVLDPAGHPVRHQLEIYAKAAVLVFSEGSAMLGRHVLGYLPQEIHVLRRRPGRDLCSPQLGPRCARLVYHPVVGAKLNADLPDGCAHPSRIAALLDLDVVFDTFGALGVDLARDWDMQAYRQELARDALGWMDNCKTAPEQVLRNLDLLRAIGVDVDGTPATAPYSH